MKALHATLIPAVLLSAALLIAKPGESAPAAATNNVDITARGPFEYDLKTGRLHWSEQVVVDDPGSLHLTCEDLVAERSLTNRRIESIVATSNVVITLFEGGVTSQARCGRAVYSAASDTFEFSLDNPVVTRLDSTSWADTIVFDRRTGKVHGRGNPRMKFNAGAFPQTNPMQRK
ncbi:MAG: hypothetical protein EXS36_02090 [Pedosphaera sp.]|nr:hypothetical protein [Pedosphaera sp.]